MFKEQIVKFSDGTYGIQTKGGWFQTPKFLWLGGTLEILQIEECFKYCKSDNLEKVRAYFDQRHLTFTPLTTNLSDHM